MAETPWDILGIARDAEPSAIRVAYSRLLKQTRPDEDAAAFQRLRQAYETALNLAAPRPLVGNLSGLAQALEPASDSVHTAAHVESDEPLPVEDAVRAILDACSPVRFDPTTVGALMASLPELVPLRSRHAAGMQLAHHIAEGVAISPHAIVWLESAFGWNDVSVVLSDPIFRDVRFIERLERARGGSRPSTRQHQTPVAAGVSIGALVLAGLANGLSQLNSHIGPSRPWIRSSADMIGGSAIAIAVLSLIALQFWAAADSLTATTKRVLLAARIVLGVLALGGFLYFVGRP